MSHSVGIVGHADRTELINTLADRIRPDILSIDDGQLGCEGNHRNVWKRLANDYPSSRWTVVIEDDALPVADFDTQLEAALRVAPTPVVSLYLGRLRPPQHQGAIGKLVATNPAEHWLVATRLLHAVGVAIRTPLVPDMLSHVSTWPRCPIDEAITRWCIDSRNRVSYTWPSLVDHADTPTVVQHPDRQPRPPGRTAWRVGERTAWAASSAALVL
jgi:hypothetical protein